MRKKQKIRKKKYTPTRKIQTPYSNSHPPRNRSKKKLPKSPNSKYQKTTKLITHFFFQISQNFQPPVIIIISPTRSSTHRSGKGNGEKRVRRCGLGEKRVRNGGFGGGTKMGGEEERRMRRGEGREGGVIGESGGWGIKEKKK